MHFTYRTKGTCSQEILFDVDGKTVKNIEFMAAATATCRAFPSSSKAWTSTP